MSYKLLIVSHGHLAQALLDAAEMIVGDLPQATAIGMTHDMGQETTMQKIKETLDANQDASILILADLFGGTPFNAALLAMGQGTNVEIVTGVNLAMILQFATTSYNSLTQLADHIQCIGKTAIQGQTYQFEDDTIDF